MKKYLLTAFLFFFLTISALAQISGRVLDAETNEPLPGATILVQGTSIGVTTGFDGTFIIEASAGDILVISFVGYEQVEVAAGSNMEVSLSPGENVLGELVVSSNVVDIAKTRETPVAVSTISPSEINLKVGNQEFPEIMRKTPSIYVTKQGGGYGDSRINIRGFDQRNTAYLINGQPVNDMENGWVYWSNWQGLTDVASGIQIQRGLGASMLAVPSVGGTVSILTKTAENERGGSVSQMLGNDGYTKTSIAYNSGLNDNGWSTSLLLSYWAANGYVDNTSGEGWTYFAAVGYVPGERHSLNLSLLGAGQWHHQRSVWVSIRDYEYFGDDGIDRKWNTNGGTLNGDEFSMARNFYNKPLATLNWDFDISENVQLATSLYGSAGRGGGTGTRGQNFFNGDINILPFNIDLYEHLVENGNGAASRNPDGTINFDNVVAVNRNTTSGYTGGISGYEGGLIGSNGYSEDGVNNAVLVRRASMNSHNWYGLISNLDITSGNFTYSVGIDLRDYTGYHYRALNDLLGLDGYFSRGNQNSAGLILEDGNTIKASPFRNTGIAGQKMDYYNIGYVGWQGVNGMIEYNDQGRFTAVLQGGLSNQSYQREDLFDQTGNALSDTKNVLGGYVKGGANYNLNEKNNVFFNAGYISRQPNFDAVFPNFANAINPDLQNEEITSVELGYGFISNSFRLNLNLYSTVWGNVFEESGYSTDQGVEGTAQFNDIDVRHNGIELETSYRPFNELKLTGMLSVGDWRYTQDFDAILFDDNQQQIGTATLYTKDAKVGNAAQTTAYIEADYSILSRWSADLGFWYADNLYADYSATDSDFTEPDNDGAVKLPSYGLLDFGTTVRFDLFGQEASFRVNVNNVFDTTYIAESNSNLHATSGSETWKGIDKRNYVWFGFGRTWNASLKYNF